MTGERWWWRVEYRAADGTTATLANEIRLPVGQRTGFTLETADVIHSFWIPPLGGKMDMIPGRVTELRCWSRRRTGTFRPPPPPPRRLCRNIAGTALPLMAFSGVRWMGSPIAFVRVAGRARPNPGAAARSDISSACRDLFLGYGCGGCHWRCAARRRGRGRGRT